MWESRSACLMPKALNARRKLVCAKYEIRCRGPGCITPFWRLAALAARGPFMRTPPDRGPSLVLGQSPHRLRYYAGHRRAPVLGLGRADRRPRDLHAIAANEGGPLHGGWSQGVEGVGDKFGRKEEDARHVVGGQPAASLGLDRAEPLGIGGNGEHPREPASQALGQILRLILGFRGDGDLARD